MWLLCPSTPQACSTRSTKPSSPGRPTWYITSSLRSSTMAWRIRPAMSATASSQETRSNWPEPRSPTRSQRVEDPLGVVHLVDRGRPLGAVAAAGARVRRVALELLDRQVLVVDVGQQAARGLAVEADRRDQRVGVRNLARVRLRVVLDVVVPVLDRRVVAQVLVAALPGIGTSACHAAGVMAVPTGAPFVWS